MSGSPDPNTALCPKCGTPMQPAMRGLLEGAGDPADRSLGVVWTCRSCGTEARRASDPEDTLFVDAMISLTPDEWRAVARQLKGLSASLGPRMVAVQTPRGSNAIRNFHRPASRPRRPAGRGR